MFGKRIIIFYLLYVIGKGFGETYEIINSGLDSEKSTEKSIIENDNNNTRNSDDITTKHVGNAEDNSGNSKNNNLKSVVDTTEYDDRVTEDDVFSNNTEDGDTSSTYNNDNVKTSEIENFVDKKPKYDENNEDYTKNDDDDDDDDDKEEVVEVEDELIYDEQYDEHGDKVKQHNSRSTILGEEMETCLTGYMTDVQNWVDKNGDLTCNIEKRFQLDVSKQLDAVTSLMRMIKLLRSRDRELRYISFAKCDLRRVPTVFHLQDTSGQALYSTVEYLTLYGNQFTDIGTAGEQFGEYMNATEAYKVTEGALQIPVTSAWSSGFNQVIFPRLKQLDLRRCSIQQLTYNVFKNMPNLEALYLGENSITYISGQAFYGLRSLMHLDISRNPLIYEAVGVSNLVFETTKVFSDLDKLTSLDLSWTQIRTRDVGVLSELPPRLQRLSICHGGLNMLPTGSFNNTSMKVLDISYNPGILNRYRLLEGLEDKLKVLYAKKISLKHFEHFHNYKQLIILDIFGNEITDIHPKTARSLQNLRILNLDGNRFATWFDPIFGFMSNLSLLSLRNNNVNLISNVMIEDFKNVSYIGLSENFIVCNCHTRELFELAYRNQNRTAPLITKSRFKIPGPFCYHSGFDDFNKLIFQRKNLTRYCDDEDPTCLESEDLEFEGDFLLFDFDPTLYNCLMVFEAKAVPFYHIDTCAQSKREIDFEEVIQDGWRLMFWLFIIPVVVFPILFFLYVFRRNLKYFCITIRNSATLSLINKDTVVNDDTIFNYDVFVSYCNEDRMWVLDQLLPHVEKDCNVSVCLHERDFQVGLSILENIVSCMDRSRSIMLVISQRFLLSQWCQFEMHLAQHRLLETRREDLILVLLEDIPRRLRPTTLHYLMLTKTYIVWPKNQADRHVFWKRLTRSILTHRTRGQENISLA